MVIPGVPEGDPKAKEGRRRYFHCGQAGVTVVRFPHGAIVIHSCPWGLWPLLWEGEPEEGHRVSEPGKEAEEPRQAGSHAGTKSPNHPVRNMRPQALLGSHSLGHPEAADRADSRS